MFGFIKIFGYWIFFCVVCDKELLSLLIVEYLIITLALENFHHNKL